MWTFNFHFTHHVDLAPVLEELALVCRPADWAVPDVSRLRIGRSRRLGTGRQLDSNWNYNELLVTTSKAPVTASVALVPSSFLLLLAHIGKCDN